MRRKPNRPIDKARIDVAWARIELDPTALDTPERIMHYCIKMGFVKGNYTDIEAVIRANPELTLESKDIGESDAYIVKDDESAFTIVVNSRHNENRRRFSMAHEYIHYQLHRERISTLPVGERILYRNSDRNIVEYQANRYAGELLMPSGALAAAIDQKKGAIADIARSFGVSQDALKVRVSQLGFAVIDE